MNRYDLAALDAALAAHIQEKGLPGVSVAIRSSEGVIFEKGYGFADVEAGREIDPHTVMGIASMSKSFTTLALAILEAEGRFSFDDPVVKYFPNFRVPGNPVQDVTCRHLAMHTAGIPPMEPLEWSIVMNTPARGESERRMHLMKTAPNKMETIEQIIDYIASGPYPTLGQAGECMSYSNEAYAILSYIVDKAAGMQLERFLCERVFGPLGMTRSILDLDGSEAAKIAGNNITRLYEKDDDGKLHVDDAWSILPPFRGCACVKSTAHDMARYYQCLADGGKFGGVQVIPEKAVEILIGAAFPEEEQAFYCLGLNKRTFHGHVLCEHSGGLHGVSSHGGLIRGEGLGIVALSNMGDSDADELCFLMFNMLLSLPLEESHRWLHPTGTDFLEPEMLLGSYLCNEGVPVVMEVVLREGSLLVLSENGEEQMVYCGGTWFTIYREGKLTGRVRFLVRDGRAWAARFYTRVYRRISA